MFNKISISNISDVAVNDKELTFNIIGNIDSSVEKEKEYEISLKDSNNNLMASTCFFPVLNNNLNDQTISCKVPFNKQSKISDLSFVQGVYSSKTRNDDKLILVNNNNLNIKVPEESDKLSTLAIILIAVGVVVVISLVAVFLIIKLKVFKKENKVKNEEPVSCRSDTRNKGRSERIILRSNRSKGQFSRAHN